MKKNYIFLTFVFVFACVLNMQAQSFETDITKVLSQDETVLSFNKNEARNISGILASGNIKFTSSMDMLGYWWQISTGMRNSSMNRFPSLPSKKVRTVLNLWGLKQGK